MDIGTFSVSLNVADIQASRDFYEKLGFEKVMGEQDKNWLIMQNGKAIIGLFQGMFPKNIMTMNPTDVRGIAAKLKEQGLELTVDIAEDAGESGPAHIMLKDPDGNDILIDQHA